MPGGVSDEIALKRRWVDLQCRGYSNDSIAEKTNSDPKWVRHFLTRNNMKALEKMAKMRAAERARQVMRLEFMIQEAAEAWERSKLPEESMESTEEPVGGQASVTVQGAGSTYTQVGSQMTLIKSKRTVRGKTGDVAFLKAMQEFMRDVRSILKIDDGTKRIDFSLSIPSEGIEATLNVKDIAQAELQAWNEEQKERLQKMLEMPIPEISTEPDRPLSTEENGQDLHN